MFRFVFLSLTNTLFQRHPYRNSLLNLSLVVVDVVILLLFGDSGLKKPPRGKMQFTQCFTVRHKILFPHYFPRLLPDPLIHLRPIVVAYLQIACIHYLKKILHVVHEVM